MKHDELEDLYCSVARTWSVIGERWTMMILRECFRGERRYDHFRSKLGLGSNVLNDRLRVLVAEGVLERVRYQEKPDRYEYVLAEKGRDFYPVLAAMIAWGDHWLSGEEGPPIVLRHKPCGHDMTARVVCSECGEPISARDVRARLGPGYPADRPPPGPRISAAEPSAG